MPRLDDFIVCEDARLEVSGLITLVGYFAGVLRLPGPGNLKLSCVVALGEMGGVERFLMQVESRLGDEVLSKSGVIECKRQPRAETHTIVHVLSPFPAPRPGRYKLQVTIETGGVTSVYTKMLSIDMPSVGVGQAKAPPGGGAQQGPSR
jgi:hypothetical protein